jgi:hypothetical protein
MKWVLAAALLVVLVCLAVCWQRFAITNVSVVHEDAAAIRPAIPAPAGRKKVPAANTAVAPPALQKNPDAQIDAENSPATGVDARLSEAVHSQACSPSARARARSQQQKYRRVLQGLQDAPDVTAEAIASYQAVVDNVEQYLDRCAKLPEPLRDQGSAVLERLAEAGYPHARVTYVRSVFYDYVGLPPGEVIEDIDEVIRRRDLARRYLALAVANCEDGVWSARFDAQGSGLLPDDPVARVAAMQAYYRYMMQRGAEAGQLQHIHDTLDAAAQSLDDAGRSRALQMGEADIARCHSSSH